MSVLAAKASGNFTDSATWALVDSTSYQASEAGSDSLSTAYSGTRSSAFTPGAITIDGIGVKLATRVTTTGTISVNLEKDSDDSQVAGTEVTINVSDLSAATAAALDGGWIFFKFAAPVTLAGATAYQVASKVSSSGSVSLFRDGTVDNTSRYLRTTTAQAPAAGDDLIVAGEHTAPSTATDLTVTMNNTGTTDFGSAPTAANGLLTPGLAVCDRGVVTFDAGSAVNPYLKLSNSVIIYQAGILNIGTTGTPIPRNSVAVLEFDPAADGDYGLLARNGSTLNIQGLSRTSGNGTVSCLLNTDEAVNSTSLGVDADTGWLDNDQIVVASTTRTIGESEIGALNGNAGASSLTVDGFAGAGGGLAFAHSGTSPTQAEVINLTRNIKVRSATSTLMAYVFCGAEAIVDIDWAEFYYLGENATNKRGIEVATTTGTFNMQFSSLHDCEDVGFIAIAAVNNVVFSNNVTWNLATVLGAGFQIFTATTGSVVIEDNVFIKMTATGAVLLNDVGITFNRNTVVSSPAWGVALNEASAILGSFQDNVVHSNGTMGLLAQVNVSGLIDGLFSWRNNGQGIHANGTADLTIADAEIFGNAGQNILFNLGNSLHLIDSAFNGDTTFATLHGLAFAPTGPQVVVIDGCDFSVASGILTAHTQDINITAKSDVFIVMRNTRLSSAIEVLSPGNMTDISYIAAQKLDQTSGNHKTWMRNGIVQTDATIFNTAAPSMRMTPSSASESLESASRFQGMKAPVSNGVPINISVYTRRSSAGDGAAYNGSQPQLILKANPAIGIASDVQLDVHTAADGTWEQLTGTTPSPTDDGAMEFVIWCDGTAGWVNVDDWAVT